MTQHIVDQLNHLLEIDPKAINSLFDSVAPVYNTKGMKDVPDLKLCLNGRMISILGLINYLVRSQSTSRPKFGPIVAHRKDKYSEEIVRFGVKEQP